MNSGADDKGDRPGQAGFTFRPLRPEPTQKIAPCQDNCPCGTGIRDWIAPVAQRESLGLSTDDAYAEAWKRIVDNNPFPAVMGRICPHPCELQCNRSDLGSAVAVSSMERFLGDWALDNDMALPRLEPLGERQSFGVIGAGPAGLSFAYQVARRGHVVSVYDWHPEAGGMLRYGVPEYRLPRRVLDAEIERIIDLGVELHTGVRIGTDLSLADLRERHQDLFFGLGAQRARMLNVPGENGPGVWTGTDFLERYNTERPLSAGDHLVVVGGGNTAVDTARVGRRIGARVSVVYRRSLAEIPAIASEIAQARQEGVEFLELTAPIEIAHHPSGELRGLVVQRMRQGSVDESGRHRPEPVPDSEYEITATAVVVAVSQDVDWQGLESVEPAPGACLSDDSHLTMGGDVLHQGIASAAIADGRQAALTACNIAPEPGSTDHEAPSVRAKRYAHIDRVADHEVNPELRLASPRSEVTTTISEAEFLAEVERCLSCGSCLGCYQCWMYCNAGSFTPVEQPTPGNYFTFDSDLCEGCGKCIELCPCGFLSPLSNPPPY